MAQVFMDKKPALLTKFYDEDAVLMPEFHATLFGKKSIASYYQA
jgi:ketosteroid isomerase-like protein